MCTFFSEDHKLETVNIRMFVYVCITSVPSKIAAVSTVPSRHIKIKTQNKIVTRATVSINKHAHSLDVICI